MQLTGKCKEDFLNYYWDVKIKPLPMTMCKKEDLELFFDSISEIFQHALIIEWLDTLGIYILPYRENELFYCELQFSKTTAEKSGKNWILTNTRISRNESISNSIKEVNEIYNEKELTHQKIN